MKKWGKTVLIVLVVCGLLAAAAGAGIAFYGRAKALYDNLIEQVSIRQTSSDRETDRTFDYSWTEGQTYICHALGEVDGRTYTNSKEAFLTNYESGRRIFEVDFDYCPDDYSIVLSHSEKDWREMSGVSEDTAFTKENFMNSKLYGKYTTMDFNDLLDCMEKYPDIAIVTDTKYKDKASVIAMFSQMTEAAKNRNPEILDRIIPQIYDEEMYWTIMQIYPFKSVIFTLYETDWNVESVMDICLRTGIRFVTVDSAYIGKKDIALWKTMGLKIAVHTINDADRAKQFLDMGADMIYTDSLF